MPRPCSICAHEHVEEINEMMIRGATYQQIMERYGGSLSALHRHKQHLTAQRQNKWM